MSSEVLERKVCPHCLDEFSSAKGTHRVYCGEKCKRGASHARHKTGSNLNRSECGSLGWKSEASDLPLSPEPTGASPGSEEKQLVMIARAEAGYALFHPDDNQGGPKPETEPKWRDVSVQVIGNWRTYRRRRQAARNGNYRVPRTA